MGQRGSDKRTQAVGLGLGVPLAVGVIAALAFFGVQARRRNGALTLGKRIIGQLQPPQSIQEDRNYAERQSQPTELSVEWRVTELPA